MLASGVRQAAVIGRDGAGLAEELASGGYREVVAADGGSFGEAGTASLDAAILVWPASPSGGERACLAASRRLLGPGGLMLVLVRRAPGEGGQVRRGLGAFRRLGTVRAALRAAGFRSPETYSIVPGHPDNTKLISHHPWASATYYERVGRRDMSRQGAPGRVLLRIASALDMRRYLENGFLVAAER